MLLLFVTVVTVVRRSASRKCQKTHTWVFSGHFRVLPALDAGDRRGSLPGLPYCCSAGLTLATVVGEPHCCSVVTVNTSNTVQLPTLKSPTSSEPNPHPPFSPLPESGAIASFPLDELCGIVPLGGFQTLSKTDAYRKIGKNSPVTTTSLRKTRSTSDLCSNCTKGGAISVEIRVTTRRLS